MDFSDKVALVTGSASGIGEDAAKSFAKYGAKLVLVDLNENGLNCVSRKIEEDGFQISLKIIADITKDAKQIIKVAIDHSNQLDIVVNCVGILRFDSPITVNLDVFDKIFAINVRSIIEINKLAIPYLEKTKGNIINV